MRLVSGVTTIDARTRRVRGPSGSFGNTLDRDQTGLEKTEMRVKNEKRKYRRCRWGQVAAVVAAVVSCAGPAVELVPRCVLSSIICSVPFHTPHEPAPVFSQRKRARARTCDLFFFFARSAFEHQIVSA